jgi:protein associated with RNAse G/E
MGKRNKYGATKVKFDGKMFDSKLELFAWKMLTNLKIPFDWQVRYNLQESFKYDGKTIRKIDMVIDFVIHMPDREIVVDTKGFATEVSKIKYKMLKYQMSIVPFPMYDEVIWLENEKEVKGFIYKIYEECQKRKKTRR